MEEYKSITRRVREQYSVPSAPAMPILPPTFGSHMEIASGDCSRVYPAQLEEHRPHEDSDQVAGVVSDKWFAMVHTPVPINEAVKIPNAAKAVDKE